MKRRDFLATSTAALAAFGALPALARCEQIKVGVQLFSLPKMLEKDFRKAIAYLAQLHYSELEFYGPYTFSAPEQIAGWKAITPQLGFSGSGFFGLSLSEVQSVLKQHRMTVPSMHTDLETLGQHMGPLSEAAQALGATYVTLPAIPEEKRKTLDDYKRIATTFNEIGAQAKSRGVKFAYHNHGYGLHKMEGRIPFELILEQTDPALVFLELDTFWTTAGGGDPVAYLKNHPGRYKLIHLKDMKALQRFSGDGGNPGQWIELFPNMTSVGDGVLDMKRIVAQARLSGVEHFFVEQDMVANPHVALRRSADFLSRICLA